MKKAIGILKNPDNGEAPMTIYYNGPGESLTAENNQLIEYMEYIAKDEADAKEAAALIYSAWPWDYEAIE